MKTRAALTALGFAVWAIGCAPLAWGGSARARDPVPRRLVSLAPSITETLYALGAGDRLLAATDYCDYPAEAGRLPKVGGYYNPNYEVIVSLHPDVAVLLTEHQDAARRLRQLRVPVLAVEMHSLAGLITTYLQLGALCGAEAQGAVLIRDLLAAVAQCRPEGPAPNPAPRVLLVISRDYQEPGIRETYAAGRGEFYDELLQLAGAENAYGRRWPKYPKLTAEGLLAIDPDVIIELVADPRSLSRPVDRLAADWRQVPGLRAARDGRVEILAGSYTVRPGPRLPLLLRDLRRLVRAGKEAE